jgi:arginine-tRNA-protein transferase
MTYLNDLPLKRVNFFVTSSYPCSYLPGRMARSLVATPSHAVDTHTYGELIDKGFRRSGMYTYRPQCDFCRACIPVRVLTHEFKPNRSHRRTLKKNENLTVKLKGLSFDAEHFSLYERYQKARHQEDGDSSIAEQYQQFLLRSNVNSILAEFREDGMVRIVSLIDRIENGLSAVYTFYDPHLPERGLGTYAILWQIAQCKSLGLPYLYLGYWIKESAKMAYKIRFTPLEIFTQGSWRLFALPLHD